jgi:predicted metal-dependent enzyme (double-stranded beta helix superfamily)
MTLELDRRIQALFDAVERSTPGSTASSSPDLEAIGAALGQLAGDRAALRPWIERLGDRSGAIPIHAPPRGPRLMLVHRLHGQLSAVHDHGTWVAISAIRGVETHRRWRVSRHDGPIPTVELADDRALGASDVATLLPPDDVHDHGHLAGRGDPAHVLILLGDDQTRFTRNEWDAASGRHRILSPGDGGRWLASDPMPDANGPHG